MEIIFKRAWVIFIAVTIANVFILKYRTKKYIVENSGLKDSYHKFFKGLLIYGNIPWVIMMIGDLSGTIKNVFEYFNPKAMKPLVLTFHFSIVVLWILSVRWFYFKKGAEFLETHSGILQRRSIVNGNVNITAKQIKLFFPLMLLGGIVGMIMMWISDFPIPEF